jgi:hypothetical protein
MSPNISALKKRLVELLKSYDYDSDDIIRILRPISMCTNNELFQEKIEEIVSIVGQDRAGNNKFDINDLKLLSKDIIAVTSLITSILIVIAAIPDLKLSYDEGASEELIFKLLVYIFLVVLPNHTGTPWTLKEKIQVIDLILTIYQLIKSSQISKELFNKIIDWFKTKSLCSCINGSVAEQKQTVLEKKLPYAKFELLYAMNNVRDKVEMHGQIKDLKRKITSKNSN